MLPIGLDACHGRRDKERTRTFLVNGIKILMYSIILIRDYNLILRKQGIKRTYQNVIEKTTNMILKNWNVYINLIYYEFKCISISLAMKSSEIMLWIFFYQKLFLIEFVGWWKRLFYCYFLFCTWYLDSNYLN